MYLDVFWSAFFIYVLALYIDFFTKSLPLKNEYGQVRPTSNYEKSKVNYSLSPYTWKYFFFLNSLELQITLICVFLMKLFGSLQAGIRTAHLYREQEPNLFSNTDPKLRTFCSEVQLSCFYTCEQGFLEFYRSFSEPTFFIFLGSEIPNLFFKGPDYQFYPNKDNGNIWVQFNDVSSYGRNW